MGEQHIVKQPVPRLLTGHGRAGAASCVYRRGQSSGKRVISSESVSQLHQSRLDHLAGP